MRGVQRQPQRLGRCRRSPRFAILADTPWFSTSPVQCASLNVENLKPCRVARDEVIDRNWLAQDEATVEAAGAAYVDLTNTYCTDHCSPIIADTVVFRDTHHLTATFAKALSVPFRERLAAAGLL